MQRPTIQINPRRRRRGLAAAAALACALAALPAGADASATVFKANDGDVYYTADSGEDNDLLVSLTIGGVVFTESSSHSVTTNDADCEQIDPHAVKCDDTGIGIVRVNAGDGDNDVNVGLPYPVRFTAAPNSTNKFFGGDGDDGITGGDGADDLNGGRGNDVVEGNGGADLLKGGEGNDHLRGGDEVDTLFADPGQDELDGGDASDYADYSARSTGVKVSLDDVDNDGSRLIVQEQDNVRKNVENVLTGSGDDHVEGSLRDNLVITGAGDDQVEGGEGNDGIYTMEGNDRAEGGPGDDAVAGDSTNGAAGNDDLAGGPGDDIVLGRGGDDLLAGNAGRDDIAGGDGHDAVSYADAAAPVTADLDGVTYDDGTEGEGDTLGADIEDLTGGPFDDHLAGNAGVNALAGGGGNDTIDSRDAVADSVDCGAGVADTGLADGADAVTACELPKAPAEPGQQGGGPGGGGGGGDTPALPAGPQVALGPKALRLDAKGYAAIKVACPRTAPGACSGTLSVNVKKQRVGSAKFTVAPGAKRVVKVRIDARWRKRIARGAVKTAVVAQATAGQTQARTSTQAITFKPPLKARRR